MDVTLQSCFGSPHVLTWSQALSTRLPGEVRQPAGVRRLESNLSSQNDGYFSGCFHICLVFLGYLSTSHSSLFNPIKLVTANWLFMEQNYWNSQVIQSLEYIKFVIFPKRLTKYSCCFYLPWALAMSEKLAYVYIWGFKGSRDINTLDFDIPIISLHWTNDLGCIHKRKVLELSNSRLMLCALVPLCPFQRDGEFSVGALVTHMRLTLVSGCKSFIFPFLQFWAAAVWVEYSFQNSDYVFLYSLLVLKIIYSEI